MSRRIARMLVLGAAATAASLAVAPLPAVAQPLGTFAWQLEPYCNRVTVNVTQNGAIYTLDGYDDQCGAGQRAPLVGLATPNPDGTIGLGFSIVTVPGGKPVHVDARITLPSASGSWSDSVGNAGTFPLGGNGAGSPRPAPSATAPPGSVGSTALVPGAVTSAAIADGSVGAADIDQAQVQRRISGACSRGLFFVSVAPDGVPTCTDGDPAANVTALGPNALAANTTGTFNVAIGAHALNANADGDRNVAVGAYSLNRADGFGNTAVGDQALQQIDGTLNTALGYAAGYYAQSGSNNVHIANFGAVGDTAVIKIGSAGAQFSTFLAGVRGVTTTTTAIPVLVGTDGQLGTTSSSRRFKDDIADMGAASDAIFRLRPVTFRYTQPQADGSRPLDYGLVAEEVAETFPALAVFGEDGQAETVAYHKLPVLLLNEIQMQQTTIAEQATSLTRQAAQLERQAATLAALEARLAALEHTPPRR